MSDGQLCAGLNLTLLGLDGSRTFEGAARRERSGLGAAQTMQSTDALSESWIKEAAVLSFFYLNHKKMATFTCPPDCKMTHGINHK